MNITSRVAQGLIASLRAAGENLKKTNPMYIGHPISCLILSAAVVVSASALAQPVPSPGPTRPAIYNECLASIWESNTGSPYSGVCEKKFINGKYVCVDFAREHCDFVNGVPSASGKPRCWVANVNIDISASGTKYQVCAMEKCGSTWDFVMMNQGPARWCNQKFKDCYESYVVGHALNVIRTEEEAHLQRYGSVAFALYEPQISDPTTATFCTWRQDRLDPPVIPEQCKKDYLAKYYPDQIKCGIPYKFTVRR